MKTKLVLILGLLSMQPLSGWTANQISKFIPTEIAGAKTPAAMQIVKAKWMPTYVASKPDEAKLMAQMDAVIGNPPAPQPGPVNPPAQPGAPLDAQGVMTGATMKNFTDAHDAATALRTAMGNAGVIPTEQQKVMLAIITP